ncbi:MAG: glycosyltransferase [Chloroflexi bacterium]|nr:glycosyltransferase [Chloroflexota bacterium]
MLHVYHDFAPVRGGIEDYLADLTRLQVAQGIEPVVLTSSAGPVTRVDTVDGVRIIRAASFGRWFTPFCPSWPRWVRAVQADIVHLHLPCPLGEWSLLAAPPRRLVISLHNDYVRPWAALALHRPLHQRMLARAQAVIVATADYARTSPALAGRRDGVQIVPYGIDTERYTPGSVAPGGAPVLSAGRLCYYKGVEVLLAAAPQIDGSITIAGDGPWRARLHRQAARAGLNERVAWAGAVTEEALIALMRSARVFVFPSTERAEAFGLAQLKAMACGLPVVSSDLPGVRWLNRDGETGLSVPVRDAPALASALNRLLGDEGLRARMGSAARLRAAEFTPARMAEETLAVYRAIG